jgi:uncharacterized repeat protein (TIGR01451 family)
MNRVKKIMRNISIILASLLMVLSIPNVLLAQDHPAPKPFSLKGPRMLIIPDTADYSIIVFNSEDMSKEDTRVVLNLPQNLKYIGSTHQGVVTPSKGDAPTIVAWQLGNMTPGQQIEIKARVKAVKTGRVSIDAECLDATRTTPIKASSVVSIMGVPHLNLSTYDTEDPVAVGKNTTYVFEVLNDGSSPATNITVWYQVPEQMEFVSAKTAAGLKYVAEGNTVKFTTAPILQPGEKITYRIVCKVMDVNKVMDVDLRTGMAFLRYDQSPELFGDKEGTSIFR